MAFCGYLKQSTAVTIQLGPFVDETDGKTAETGLTIEDTDIYLSKNGAAQANPNDTDNAAHDALGYYTKALDGTDTGTLGLLTVVVHESGALPVRQDYQVVVAHWWDTMCGSDNLHVDVIEVGGTAQTANDNGADINAILVDTAEIGAAGVGLTAIPWNAAWDAEVESEMDDALGAGGADLTAIPWNAAWDAEVESEVEDAVGADVTAILADTDEIQQELADGGRTDLLIDAILDDTGSSGVLIAANAIGPDALHTNAVAEIVDAVWDEALADHDTEDTIGNVINDLVEESGGTYRFTEAALAESPTSAGAGATTFTYTLTSTVDASPIASATVWVTTDEAGTNVVASGTTDTNGQVVFYLDAGTYYVWREKAGWNFTNPDTETVS